MERAIRESVATVKGWCVTPAPALAIHSTVPKGTAISVKARVRGAGWQPQQPGSGETGRRQRAAYESRERVDPGPHGHGHHHGRAI